MKLTKAQRHLLEEVARHTTGYPGFDGRPMYDGIEAGIATRLAEKGLVSLPAGHGHIFGHRNGVMITDAGRAALRPMAELRTDSEEMASNAP
jgi:hypothetical protein